MLLAVNFSKTVEMPSTLDPMYPVAYYIDLIKQHLSKYLKLEETEKRTLFTHYDYPKYSLNSIILRYFSCYSWFNIDASHQ